MGLSVNAYRNGLQKILGRGRLKEYEKIIHKWAFDKNPAHAGQIFSQKTLPNGNIQERVTTFFGNNLLGLDTAVYSPNKELLKNYVGLRDAAGKTWRYASGTKEEVAAIRRGLYEGNSEAKRLFIG